MMPVNLQQRDASIGNSLFGAQHPTTTTTTAAAASHDVASAATASAAAPADVPAEADPTSPNLLPKAAPTDSASGPRDPNIFNVLPIGAVGHAFDAAAAVVSTDANTMTTITMSHDEASTTTTTTTTTVHTLTSDGRIIDDDE